MTSVLSGKYGNMARAEKDQNESSSERGTCYIPSSTFKGDAVSRLEGVVESVQRQSGDLSHLLFE